MSAYFLVKLISQAVTKTFFREIKVIGAQNVPKDGPVIICSNHNNQFIDALNIVTNVPRKVQFIIAAKSMRRPVIGHFGKALGGIPVERAIDLAQSGSGKIVSVFNDTIKGQDTLFTKELTLGSMISMKEFDDEFTVSQIVSDNEVIVSYTQKRAETQISYSYKIIPKIDQHDMFSAVWDNLNQGNCIGIFPEGGSHDRTDLLPLKAGVCIMALGTMAKYQKQVTIVTCGLNYFKGDRFRSKVFLQFGMPYEVPQELVDLYNVRETQREAISSLLKEIENRLRDVTITAQSYQDMSCIHLSRDIYKPENKTLSPQQMLELSRRFSLGYQKFKDNDKVRLMYDNLKNYHKYLKQLGINDSQVSSLQNNFFYDSLGVIYALGTMVICAAFAAPGIILNGPIAIILRLLAEKQRKKALANSRVKITGKDVVASQQVKLGMFAAPLSLIIYSFVFYLLSKFYLYPNNKEKVLKSTFIFFVLYPLYAYLMLQSTDNFIKQWKSLWLKLILLFKPESVGNLKQQREVIQQKIRELVEKHFHEAISKDRIIKQQEINRNKNSDGLDEAMREVFQSLEEIGI